MRAEARLLLALDFGGTKHAAALAAVGKRAWLASSRVACPPGADAHYDRATMLRMARELLARTPGRLAAVGVSFGGPVDARRGLVRMSHHVPGWEDVPLAEELAAEFGAPVVIDNDANVAAFGEWRFGAGQGASSLLYLTVSTGIGGGWVLDGRIYGGADGAAGEIGHMLVRPGGALCPCGQRGCLEAEACGRAIGRKAAERLAADPQRGTLLRDLTGGDPGRVTGELTARAAAMGDSLAQEVLDDAASMLGRGLAAAINLMNPECVVLGGGVTKAGERWWRVVRETARHAAVPQARVEIVSAALEDDAPLWGAVALAQQLIAN